MQKCKVIHVGIYITYITWIYAMHENLWDANERGEINLTWLIISCTMCPDGKAKSSKKGSMGNTFGKYSWLLHKIISKFSFNYSFTILVIHVQEPSLSIWSK